MAFDKINRTLLLEKLVSTGINGPILKVIFYMYADAKSCVNLNGKMSEFFQCSTGVRQGENLSPYGQFVKCNQYISEVGNKTLFTLLRKARKLNLPVDLVSQLFDVMVSPVLLYGCEIYAPYPHFEIERIHLKFCKYLLGVSSRTTNVMVYGELGRMPLEMKIKTRIVSFWSKIITGKQTI